MSIPLCPFYFLRHGETDWNRYKWIMGHQDITLNENGKHQARNMKASIAKLDIKCIWSSPLLRARETAEIINESFHYPLYFAEELKERCWGDGEGTSIEQVLFHEQSINGLNKSSNEELPLGAEPYKVFETRIISAFQKILADADLPILIVGHGGFLSVLSLLLVHSKITADNCGLFYLKPTGHAGIPWTIINMND